ncbi:MULTISPECIES: alpha-ketoglutarate-dependent dioxygenase AlkB family protein [Thioclava]|uniref:Alkylated DNA repair dioxygenase n=1 Tax=Thioclava nitratireducens TaxID=1915078 RepID=A0ABN4X918_9RHOB|nr:MULTISPECIES: alpha-ketoglutarate-dependent dioxygenase AlkB [Thioclava]AQS46597.1 alkylated DNA repair dioxygenase [Thioclava nitratireducens]OWY02259.1 alkylated DNA repair dioxygenase [Thioclava sp. IC9]OWY08305.1 alkylated DNA repair dioxygenase [Thioclava sp. F42-5]OWY13099.1 alkylated DNA repair dioxygenase [Thioclava sp. F34-6]OWY16498.1 alkylated DNA repair dioxygenase [Thioclava sp. JM3]
MTENPKHAISRPDPQEIRGFRHYPGWLGLEEQKALIETLRSVVTQAPLFSPMTPYGKPMSVRMTSAGRFGWISDRRGYRYSETHPDGQPWPAIPQPILDIWEAVSGTSRAPECCLINFYGEGAKMGMHQDRDEQDFDQPVVSVSLGDDGLFRIGNRTRGGKTESIWLRSGDVMVMGGEARLLYHGIDRVKPGTSPLMPKGGRINLTMRVVT